MTELGEAVYKIKHQDRLKITPAGDHSHVFGHGYRMNHIRTTRHLDGALSSGVEFTEPHDKLLQKGHEPKSQAADGPYVLILCEQRSLACWNSTMAGQPAVPL